MRKIALPVLILFALTLIGCAASQRPVLYPNNYLKTVGSAQADRDINDCMQTAETYVKKNQDSKVAEGAVKGRRRWRRDGRRSRGRDGKFRQGACRGGGRRCGRRCNVRAVQGGRAKPRFQAVHEPLSQRKGLRAHGLAIAGPGRLSRNNGKAMS